MLFRFEVSEEIEQKFEMLVATPSYLGDTPRTLVSKLIAQAVERLESSTPKEPGKKQSAAERKQEDILAARAAREEARRDQYRSTGKWPRYIGQYMGHDHWKFPDFILDSKGNPGVTGEWTPPEDYPFFEEVGKMKAREEPEMTGRPKLEDFDGDEDAHFRAEMAWLKKDWTE